MLKTILKFSNLEFSQELFAELFDKSIQFKKWECGIAIRLFADEIKIDIEDGISNIRLTFDNDYRQIAELRERNLNFIMTITRIKLFSFAMGI